MYEVQITVMVDVDETQIDEHGMMRCGLKKGEETISEHLQRVSPFVGKDRWMGSRAVKHASKYGVRVRRLT